MRRRGARACARHAAALLLLAAGPAGAPPPPGDFPATLAPASGALAPRNAHIWAFGEDAPPLAAIGVAVTGPAGPIAGEAVRAGCCLLRFVPATPLPAGDVEAFVSTSGGEAQSNFTVIDEEDTDAPTLLSAALLDERPGSLIAALEGSDAHGLAGFIARENDLVVHAVAPGSVLDLRGRLAGPCVDVVAIDLAGNESPPRTLCEAEPMADAGPPPVDEEPASCAAAPRHDAGAPLFGLVALLGLVQQRRCWRRRCTPALGVLLATAALACADSPSSDAGPARDGGSSDGGALDDAGPPDALSALASLADYEAMQNDQGRVRYLAPMQGAPLVAPVDDHCVFQNARRYPYHLQYLVAQRGDDFSYDDYLALTLVRSSRAWWGGELWWRPAMPHPLSGAPGTLLFLVYAADNDVDRLRDDDVRAAYAALAACAPGFDGALAFTPGSLSQRQMAEEARAALAGAGIGVVLDPR